MFQKIILRCHILLLILIAVCAPAVKAIEPSGDDKDHPLLSRMLGYVVLKKVARQFDAISLASERDVSGEIPGAKFPLVYEGKLTSLQYQDEKSATSSFAVYRNYEKAIRSLGGRQLNSGFAQSSQGVMYRNHIFEIPHKSAAATTVLLEIDDLGKYSLTIIEPTVMAQDVKTGSIAIDLETKGVATLYVNFDENKSDLKADAVDVISQIASLMLDDPTLKLSIEGHTDNVGSDVSNKKLSTDRAQSVMRAVIAKGIAGDRLGVKGFGAEKSIADNHTEEGRAKNRRVELLKVK